MPFNYGRYDYGEALYSLKPVLALEGVLSFAPIFAGRLDRIHQSLQGGFSFTMPHAGTLSASLETFQGNISTSFAFSGILRETAGFRGDLPVNLLLAGELFRAAEREFEGNLTVEVTFGGFVGVQYLFEGVPIDIPINILGGADIYLGPFWKPDTPVDEFWVPDVPVNEFWVPYVPPSHPQVVGLNYGINAYGDEYFGKVPPAVPVYIWEPILQERKYG